MHHSLSQTLGSFNRFSGVIDPVTMTSTLPDGDTFQLIANSPTEWYAVKWWDGVTDIYGSGDIATKVSNTNNYKTIEVYAVANDYDPNPVPVKLSGTFECISMNVKSIDFGGNNNNENIYLSGNDIETFNYSGSSVYTIVLEDNDLASCNVTGCPSLTTLVVGYNVLESLNVDGLTSLSTLYCGNNLLTEISANGVALAGYYYSPSYYAYGGDLSLNNLDGAALDQFFTDLAPAINNDGYLQVQNNPGSGDCTPSIATNKGYTVYGAV